MTWANYDDVLFQLKAHGLEVSHLEVNTPKPVRCREVEGDREKRGWYWLSDMEISREDGVRGLYITGAFGIYRGAENLRHKVELRKVKNDLSREQLEAIKVQHAEKLARRKSMRDVELKRAAGRAQKAWATYTDQGSSEYLTRKRAGAYGIRFSPRNNGTLAIPMLDVAGRIWGLQIIRDGGKKANRLEKEYWPKGLEKTGHFHLIGSPAAGGIVLIAEGYATGATLHAVTGQPVAIAFDAGNLIHVAKALRAGYTGIHCLVCADDDYLQKCLSCKTPTPVEALNCTHCGAPHGQKNPGVEAARAAAFAVSGHCVVPTFPFDRCSNKLTDFNDLAVHPEGGEHHVRAQIHAALTEAGWQATPLVRATAAAPDTATGGGGSVRRAAVSVLPLADAVDRFIPIDDGTGSVLFDTWTRKLVMREQMVCILPAGIRWDDVKRHPVWINRQAYYLDEVGFDPAGTDDNIQLNLWTGWPNQPVEGKCERLLDLLRYLCSGEPNGDEHYRWILKWLAYPLQNAGAKMRSALVVHGPQGTGKSRFFEAIRDIYGDYGIILNQGAIEDKFNADWSSRKLYVLADEIVARQEMYHIKNQLKGLITGDWIRVNPKNLIAYKERNHMNIVFLSNEKQPVLLEDDDRRHCVIWTPPELTQSYYTAVHEEVEAGGIAALHHHLMQLDLTGFNAWTRPPMTRAKAELQTLSRGSVERFVAEWIALEVEIGDRKLPFCPCLGSDLYGVYRGWCERTGERVRPSKELIGHLGKLPGWRAAESMPTWRSSRDMQTTNRKMVVPPEAAVLASVEHCATGMQEKLIRAAFATQKDWLTAGFETLRKVASPSTQGASE